MAAAAPAPPAHVCQVCGRGVEAPLMCPGCQAICYCGEKHARKHLAMGHAEECGRMAVQMRRTQVRPVSEARARLS